MPTASIRSQLEAACWARRRSSLHEPLAERDRRRFEDAAAAPAGGSSSPARTRASARSIGARSPQSRHTTSRIVPWISTTRDGRRAGLQVQAVDVLGDRACRACRALERRRARGARRWARACQAGDVEPALPRALAHLGIGDVVLQRRHASRPPGSWSRRPAAPRKSGMPESVEMPAPGEHDEAAGLVDPLPDGVDQRASSLATALSTTVPLKKSGFSAVCRRAALPKTNSRKSSIVIRPCSTSS